jgi:NADPH2:quinone reductase
VAGLAYPEAWEPLKTFETIQGIAMKAACVHTQGPASNLQVQDFQTPTPGPGEILVRVACSALNPIDVYLRAGTIPMPVPKPFIPGSDYAGVVEAVGQGVTLFKVGDRVWGSNQGLLGRQGTLAEYVCTHEQWAYPAPAGVEDSVLAASALTGITAHLAVFDAGQLHKGQRLFVTGGTGGVGSFVVQMARIAGAEVITTAGSPEKAALCKAWGATHVINHRTENLKDKLAELVAQKPLDVWIETQREPNFDLMVASMAPGGRMVLIAGRAARPEFPVGPFYVKGLALTGFAMFNSPADRQAEAAREVGQWLAQKKLQVAIGATYPLDQAAEAHAFLEANTLGMAGKLSGKVVVRVS